MSATDYTPAPTGTGLKAKVQKFGSFLASMVMPNIGAFIAWGLITALFIPTGWTPNTSLGELVTPMITYLLPILIGYTGGRIVHGQRGAVIGAIATVGVVVGASVPMFLGAMIAGPAAAWVLKQFDKLTADRLRAGFEMLVDNFSLGIIGGAFAVLGKWAIGPAVNHVTDWAGHGVNWVLNHHLLPFVSILIEPAKVLFLNNAINHGVLDPLAVAQSAAHHKSILFMLESNPGPGLGILCAYLLFGPRTLRPTVPGAIVIEFLGGIHEIYFPYILMKPRLILAAIAGGFAGISVFSVTGAGLVASPSPGSIFAYLTETPRGGYFGVLSGVVVAAAVSFIVGSVLLGFGRGEKPEEAEEAGADGTDGADNGADGTSVPAQSSPEGATA
jgi:PTS system mannitol-specific IIC component